MKRSNTIGVVVGGAAALGGALLFASDRITHSSVPVRVHNVLQWLDIDRPTPSAPFFAEATLALLNAPVWLIGLVVGLLLLVVSWRNDGAGPDARQPAAKGSATSEGEGRVETLILNGFVVDPRIAALMRRSDWAGKRTSAAWLARFPAHDKDELAVQFVDFCAPDQAVSENSGLNSTDPYMIDLRGVPDLESPPGDFDPHAGYLIGFTGVVDAGIYVDLRGEHGGRIIYDNLRNAGARYVVAFNSIDEFADFYLDQHAR